MTAIEQSVPAPTPAQSYQEYYGPAIFEPLAARLVPVAAIGPGERVLDVACGTGILTRRAAQEVGAQGHVVGVDVNPGMIEVAQSLPRPAWVEFRQGDALALDLPDAAFDAVLCQQGLQFFDDRAAGLSEMRRTLAPGGRAVVAVWQGLDRHPLFAALAEAEVPHLSALGADVTYDELVAPFSLGDEVVLRSLADAAGFDGLDVTPVSIEARFATPDRFVERMEYAYAAVIPEFASDPQAFADYLAAIDAATRDIVAAHRRGDEIVVPMHALLAVAATR